MPRPSVGPAQVRWWSSPTAKDPGAAARSWPSTRRPSRSCWRVPATMRPRPSAWCWFRPWPRAVGTTKRSRPPPSLGVDEVIPWQAERSIVQWRGARAEKARESWRALLRSAAKQSRRTRVPALGPTVTTRALAARLAGASAAYVLHEDADQPLASQSLPRGWGGPRRGRSRRWHHADRTERVGVRGGSADAARATRAPQLKRRAGGPGRALRAPSLAGVGCLA